MDRSVKSLFEVDRAIDLYLEGATVEEARGITAPPITTYMFYKRLKDRGLKVRGRISRAIEVPEDALLECKSCGEIKIAAEFSKQATCKIGYCTVRCKACKRKERKTVQAWENKPLVKKILDRVKGRAIRKGIPFTLEIEDIVIPDVCPVLGMPFIYGHHDWTYSLDRIKPELGYVKGNVIVMSNRANMMKSTATTEEIGKLHAFMLSMEED